MYSLFQMTSGFSQKADTPNLDLKQQVIVEPTMRFGLVMLNKGPSNSGGEKHLPSKKMA